MKQLPITALLASVLMSCVEFRTISISQKTSLERQLMGEVEPLTEEEILLSSVRESSMASPAEADIQTRALFARKRQLFNRDDVDELRKLGCLGENSRAELAVRSCSGDVEQLSPRMASEENADRRMIVDWAISKDSSLTADDRLKVLDVYRRLIFEQAPTGTWWENEKGVWQQK